jgi:hypothetical protein
MLTAHVVKDRSTRHFFALERIPKFTISSPSSQGKKLLNSVEISVSRRITTILVRLWEVAGLEIVVSRIAPSLPLSPGKLRSREDKKRCYLSEK